MNIKINTYITHKLIKRPWGAECRFTVAKDDNTHINEVISIPSINIEESELIKLIEQRLAVIDMPKEKVEVE